MTYLQIYDQISNSASLWAILFLIAVALWILAIRKIEKAKK